MKEARQILEEFSDLAEGRCAFDLKSGIHHEGYILEVEDMNVVFGGGGPLASDINELIPLAEIDLDTLYFYRESERRYLHAKWNEEQNEWVLKPF